jgi:crossover junction endodeoxyribonuclease RuvC
MNYLGIDPGLTGAVACIFHDGPIVTTVLPVMSNVKAAERGRKRTHLNARELAALLGAFDPLRCQVFLEYTQAGMKGALANYSLGHSSGIIMGVLSALGFSYELVRPQEWKKEFGLLKMQKDASRTMAQQLFPSVNLARKKDEGRAEALLIAEWGRRQRTRVID